MPNKIKKILKNSKMNYIKNKSEIIWINDEWKTPIFFEYIKSIPSYNSGVNVDLKNKRNTLTRVAKDESNGILKEILIKEFRLKRKYDILRFKFLNSKAVRSLHMALALSEIGIKTPKPIAIIEKRDKFRNIIYSYYISEYVDSQYNFLSIMKNFDNPSRDKVKDFLIRVAKDLKIMHNNGIAHNDFHPGNILVQEIDEKLECYYIDLNRGRIKRKLSLKEKISDLIRFNMTEEEEEIFVLNYDLNNSETWLTLLRKGRKKRKLTRKLRNLFKIRKNN